jgi:alpha-tubulin suppressor-like RCC1 family protein
MTWRLERTCDSASPICLDGECVACAEGTVRCTTDGGLESCDTNRRWSGVERACPDDAPVCAGNLCLAATRVSAGGAHACAILPTGRMRCWGANDFGQLGAGDAIARRDAADAPPLVDVAVGDSLPLAVSAGGAHTCALLEGGAIKCWGQNGAGQLGLGDAEHRGDESGELAGRLPNVELGRGAVAVGLATGDRHTCALLEDGRVKCWGANDLGQLGLGDTENRGDEPDELGDDLPSVSLGEGARALAIGAGANHNCALLADGRVECWGVNEYGQLGVDDVVSRGGSRDDELQIARFGTAQRALAVAAGRNHTCALLEDGGVRCLGSNEAGQLGTGDTKSRGTSRDDPELVAVELGASVAAISAGAGHSCALLADHRVKCWGLNVAGQLGLGDRAPRGLYPGELVAQAAVDLGGAVSDPRSATAVSAGLDFTCSALLGDQIKCWGGNASGQLGVGDDRTRGDEPGELGDALPVVDWGAP